MKIDNLLEYCQGHLRNIDGELRIALNKFV